MDEWFFPGQHVAYYGTYPPIPASAAKEALTNVNYLLLPEPLFCGVVVNIFYKQTQIRRCLRGVIPTTVVTTNYCKTSPFCIHNPTIGWINDPALLCNFERSHSLTADVDSEVERLIAIHDPVTLLKIAEKLHNHSKKELKKVVKHFGTQPMRRG